MPLVTSRTSLTQGDELIVDTVVFATGTGADIRIHSEGNNNLPALAANEWFEVRDHNDTENNGLYIVVTVNTTVDDYECNKVFGAAPTVQPTQTIRVFGATGGSSEKSVFIDTAGLGIAILEQGNVDAFGVSGQAIYSFIMQEFKDDDDLIAGAPFPMLAIDSDAGKYIIGQDISGNNNGFNWFDDTGNQVTDIRTRKMLRNAGWDEVDASGVTTGRYVGVVTLGVFEDPLDTAYFQFGNDTTVNDTVDFTFADAVNEAVRFFERLADDAVGTSFAISADGRTISRSDSGNSWRDDGFKVGGQIDIRDATDTTTNGTWLLKIVEDAQNGDITCGRAAGGAAAPLAVTNTTTITRADGGSWIDDGWIVTSKLIITAAEDGGNDGTHILTSVTDTVIVMSGSSLTNQADDEAMICGMFDDAGTPDLTLNVSVNNDNEITLKLRVRDGDPKGKTFAQANLVSAGKTILGNFVYAFPLANAADQKIDVTDSVLTSTAPYVTDPEVSDDTDGDVTAGSNIFTSASTPFTDATTDVGRLITIQAGNNIGMYEIIGFTSTSIVTVDRDFGTTEGSITYQLRAQGMSIEFFATAQVKQGLDGGDRNFGIVVTGNDGTAQEVFEFIQYKLRTLGDIDSDSDTAVGRTMDGMARFVGDTGEFGTPDGLSFPRNPDGGGSGVFVDGLNASSLNDVVFYDNTNTARTFPETITVTLDFNAIAITIDTTTQYDLFYDRTIRTAAAALTDLEITTTASGTFLSAGSNLPNNSEIVVGSYVRVGGLSDSTMDGVYQIVTITTPQDSWIVTRYDGVTITVVGAGSADMDQNCVDTPDAIIVHTNIRLAEADALDRSGTALLDFATTNLINDADGGLAIFTVGMKIEVEFSTANDGIYEVTASAAGQLTVTPATITTEAVGVDTDVVITEVVTGLASLSGDITFAYEFSTNIQGGRPSAVTTFVKAKAIGSTGAQYVQSTVASIVTGTPLTIPVAPATERNYV